MKIFLNNLFVIVCGFIALIYLFNPTAGIIEIIPDNIPIIGNLDEGAAVVVLLSALRYFGYDFSKIFSKNKENYQ